MKTEPKWNRPAWKVNYANKDIEAATDIFNRALGLPAFAQWYNEMETAICRCTPTGTGIAIYFWDAYPALQALNKLGWVNGTDRQAELARLVGRTVLVNPNNALRVVIAEGALVFSFES